MKNRTRLLAILSLTLGVAAITNCDSNTPLIQNNSFSLDDSLLSTRFNLVELENNRNAIAQMPTNLTTQDLISYNSFTETFTENNVNFPTSDGEDEGVLRPLSSGAVVIEQRRYIYSRSSIDPTEATLELATSDQVSGPEFDAGMLAIAQTGEGRPGSLSSTLTTSKFPVNSANIFSLNAEEKEAIRAAVSSLGYVAVDIPNATAVGRGRQGDTVQVDVDNIVVLTNRRFTHTVTSTNADILDSGIIRGTFTLIDTYYDLALEASVNDVFYRVIIARIPTFTENLQFQTIQPEATGEFILELGSLQNTNPNP